MPDEHGKADRDLSVRHVVIGASAIVGMIIASLLAAWGLIEGFGGQAHDPAVQRPPFPKPELQRTPLADRAEYERSVGIDPHVGGKLSLDTAFRDERGSSHPLGELVAGHPAVLALVYFDCPNLCSLTLRSLAHAVAEVPPTAGLDYQVIAISIDPREGPALAAARARSELAERRARAPGCRDCGPAWHFLTGADANIRRVAQSLGFRYAWDARTAQYAHPAGAAVISASGRIVQYLNGIEFPPTELRSALSLAASDRNGRASDQFWLLCYHYEALVGRYANSITAALRVLGLASVAALGVLLVRLARARA